MATKKSTPKKTNTKTKTSVARTAGKGFAAGLNSTLGPDPKPYNRAKTSGTKTSGTKTSTGSVKAKSLGNAKTHGNTQRKADHQEQMASRKTSTGKSGHYIVARMVHKPSEETLKATNTAASTARGQRLNSSASMPKGVSGRIDRRADGSLVTEPPKSSARANVGDAYIARDGVRNTLTGELISKPKSNRKRFLPVDHGAAGELPAGATSAKYDSYTGKFVPVFNSGSKKK